MRMTANFGPVRSEFQFASMCHKVLGSNNNNNIEKEEGNQKKSETVDEA